MKNALQVLQISFTYTGTVVGAGFATGQEILQFFTLYGWWAPFTIGLTTVLFIWLGTKLMILSHHIHAKSYEDVNKLLCGEWLGGAISLFTTMILICVNSIMLACIGSIFVEYLHLNYQIGLLLTLAASFLVISRGMKAIIRLNSFVVPIMLIFTTIVITHTLHMSNVDQLLLGATDKPFYAAWAAPLIYSAFNLPMAQAVLVPLGASISNRRVIQMGGIVGGIFIGLMLLAGHFALSAQMPEITQFDIPMGQIASGLGLTIQIIYIFLIFAEIFTTLVSDLYGVTLQLYQRTQVNQKVIIICMMLFCYVMSQFGFRPLMSFLYPLFGVINLVWIYLLMRVPPISNLPVDNQSHSAGTSPVIIPLQPNLSPAGRKKG